MLCQFIMAANKFPQIQKKTTQKQTGSEFLLRPLQGVGQDRSAPKRARAGSAQPLRVRNGILKDRMDKNSDRLQKQPITGPKVLVAGFVPKPIAQEIDRITKESGKTRSQTIATLLEEAVHQKLHIRHAVMLAPLIREAVVRSFQPLLPLLFSIAYDTHQTRSLAGISLAKSTRPEEMDDIRVRTAKKARDTILHQRSQIAELAELVKASLPALWEPEAPGETPISRRSGRSEV